MQYFFDTFTYFEKFIFKLHSSKSENSFGVEVKERRKGGIKNVTFVHVFKLAGGVAHLWIMSR